MLSGGYLSEGSSDDSAFPAFPLPEPLASGQAVPASGLAPAGASPVDTQQVSDNQLVGRAGAGDRDAYNLLVQRFYPRLRRVVISLVKESAVADDLLQEAFLRGYRASSRFDGRSEAYTWFYRIAINVALNHLRGVKRSKVRPLEEEDAQHVDERIPNQSPQQLYQGRELYRELCVGIDGLSESLRVTLILVAIDGLSHDQAAEVLSVPAGTIAWRIHEARKKLKEYMQMRGYDKEVAE
jgi:RNA polymerase sigma-70 factor, ECF subfamily